jgi:hypothetical protein
MARAMETGLRPGKRVWRVMFAGCFRWLLSLAALNFSSRSNVNSHGFEPE